MAGYTNSGAMRRPIGDTSNRVDELYSTYNCNSKIHTETISYTSIDDLLVMDLSILSHASSYQLYAVSLAQL